MAANQITSQEVENLMGMDAFVHHVQLALAENIGWFDNIYGIAERVKTNGADGKPYFSPAWYTKKRDYEYLTPDDIKGNYGFFYLQDPQTYIPSVGMPGKFKGVLSFIVWFNYEDVNEENGVRNKEAIKESLIRALSAYKSRGGQLTVSKVYERAENVFQGFSLDEVDNQFMMQPFGGFRFDCEYIVLEDCV